MAPTAQQIVQAAKAVVFKAKRDDRLSEITIKVVRREVEKNMDLEEGACDEWKREIKEAVNWALENDDPAASPASKSEEKSPGRAKKRKPPAGEDKPVKKPRSSGKDDQRAGKGRTEPAGGKRKSAEKVVKSDEEEQGTTKKERAEAVGRGTPEAKSPVLKPSASPSKSESPSKPPPKADDMSDTELSSLYDEPALKRGRKKGKTSGEGEGEGGKGKRAGKREKRGKAEGGDPVEEEVARLKKLVTACGIRKIWSKEHAGLSASQQVGQLRRLLAELGMTGRLSLEKARRIRERREMLQELEDVVEYEKARGVGAEERVTRAAAAAGERKRKKVLALSEDEEDDEGGEEDEEVAARQKREQDLLAFIGDQSDDE